MYLFSFKSIRKMQFNIHNTGWVYLITSLILSFIFFPFFQILGIFFILLSFFIFYFFRDPIRSIPKENFILSPADGIVTYVGEENLPINIDAKHKFIKISIFLNIFNVHVNRIPTHGIIEKINYIHGKFINATLNKSSKHNERNIIVIKKNNNDFIVVTQIAGLIARRIVCNIKENQEVIKGHRFGIIKFGSRVDIYMPKNYKPLVSAGQTVIGGETILANPNKYLEISKSNKN